MSVLFTEKGAVVMRPDRAQVFQMPDGKTAVTGLTPPAIVAGAKNLSGAAYCRSVAAVLAGTIINISRTVVSNSTLTCAVHNGKTELDATLRCTASMPRMAFRNSGGFSPIPTQLNLSALDPYGARGAGARVRARVEESLKRSGSESYLRLLTDLSVGGGTQTATNIFTQTGEAGATATSGTSNFGTISYGATDDSKHYWNAGQSMISYRNEAGTVSAINATIFGTFLPYDGQQVSFYAYSASRIAFFYAANWTSSGKVYTTFHMSYSTNGGSTWTAVMVGDKVNPVASTPYYPIACKIARASPTDTTRIHVVFHYYTTTTLLHYLTLYWVDTATFTYGHCSSRTGFSSTMHYSALQGQAHPHVEYTTNNSIFYAGSNGGGLQTIIRTFDAASATAWKTATLSVGTISTSPYTAYDFQMHYILRNSGAIWIVGYRRASATVVNVFRYDLTEATFISPAIVDITTPSSTFQTHSKADSDTMTEAQTSCFRWQYNSSAIFQSAEMTWANTAYPVFIGGAGVAAAISGVSVTVPLALVPIDMALLSTASATLEVSVGQAVTLDGIAYSASLANLNELTVGGLRLDGVAYCNSIAALLDLRIGNIGLEANVVTSVRINFNLGVLHSVALSGGLTSAAAANASLHRGALLAGSASSTVGANATVLREAAPLTMTAISYALATVGLYREVFLAGVAGATCSASLGVRVTDTEYHVRLPVFVAEDYIVVSTEAEGIWVTT